MDDAAAWSCSPTAASSGKTLAPRLVRSVETCPSPLPLLDNVLCKASCAIRMRWPRLKGCRRSRAEPYRAERSHTEPSCPWVAAGDATTPVATTFGVAVDAPVSGPHPQNTMSNRHEQKQPQALHTERMERMHTAQPSSYHPLSSPAALQTRTPAAADRHRPPPRPHAPAPTPSPPQRLTTTR